MRIITLVLMLMVGMYAGHAYAQSALPEQPENTAATLREQAPDIAPSDAIQAAKWLIHQHRNDEARELLFAMADDEGAFTRPQRNEIEFLLGMIAFDEGNHEEAIYRFRRVLASDPDAVRVRLELGRAFYLSYDYANAQRQFMFARAGNLPEAVRQNIDRYLLAIRSLRTMRYSFSVSVASDSNLNAGPAADSVTMYGLPFQLSDSAKANSGSGLAVDAAAEFAPRIGKRLKWRMGGQLRRAQYRRTQFDDMTISAYTGPHLTLRKWDLNLLGTAARRWYGNKPYTDVIGTRISGNYFLTSRLRTGAAIAFSNRRYPQNAGQSGMGGNVSANLSYTPSTSATIRTQAAFGWHNAKDKAFANRITQLTMAITKEFAGGFTVTAAPSYSRIAYREALAAFGKKRLDHQLSGQITLLNRKIDFYGVTPRIMFTHIHNASNIDLYRFRRNRFEIGVTRYF